MKIVPLIKTVALKTLKTVRYLMIVSVIATSLATSCKDKPGKGVSPCEANPGNCKSILEAKDFFVFKTGSYWVYEEETSHERDSLYVTQSVNDENGYNFLVKIKSSLTDYEYRYWPVYYSNISGCEQSNNVTKKCLYVNRSKGKFQDLLGESHVFFINYKVGDYSTTGGSINYCQNNRVTVGEIYDSYTIPLGEFNDVVRIDEDCDATEGRQPTKFYYSKSHFIIRKELLDSNQVWNLVNCHIEH